MSGPINTSTSPDTSPATPPETACLERYSARSVDLAGLTVRRALPKRQRRSVGAWCFLDHFGPTTNNVMLNVGPHPHIGLQTVTWLIEGQIMHHDSLGHEQAIRPGQLNLMSAGNGISHAEETPTNFTGRQHGAQLWVAQPNETRFSAPAFEHHEELPRLDAGGMDITVMMGELDGLRSPARIDTPLVGVVVEAHTASQTTIPLDATFEHAVVVLEGTLSLGGQQISPGELVYIGTDRDELALRSTEGATALVIGGEPFEDELIMWWNFVVRTDEEARAAYEDWQEGHERFGTVTSNLPRIDAPPFKLRRPSKG